MNAKRAPMMIEVRLIGRRSGIFRLKMLQLYKQILELEALVNSMIEQSSVGKRSRNLSFHDQCTDFNQRNWLARSAVTAVIGTGRLVVQAHPGMLT